jgi:Mrp family chromosome partitioning ATPase
MTKLRAVLRRRWSILLIALLLGAVAGYMSSLTGAKREVTMYQAEQVIIANRLSGNPANVPQDALKLTRGPVPKAAAESLGVSVDALIGDTRVYPDAESSSIELLVYDTDPEQASRAVQQLTNEFLEQVNTELRSEDQRLLDQLGERAEAAAAALSAFDELNGFITRPDVPLPQTESIDALVAERARLREAADAAASRLAEAQLEVSQREPYSTLGPERPKVADSQLLEVPSSPLFRAGMLGLIGLLLGVGLVMVVERVNQRVDTRDELAELVTIPIVAEIGKVPARRRPNHGDGRIKLDGIWSEHYRRVRSAIQFVQADAEAKAYDRRSAGNASSAVIEGHRAQSGAVPRVFLFASALPGEGKSTSAALTALALAETGTDTLVVNADFRKPMIEKYLGVADSPSLADRAEMSVDRMSVDDIVQATDEPHLWVAAGGRPTNEVGGRLDAAREVIAEAAARGGTVLVDSSPLRVSNDPIDLLSAVDEVILVVRAGRTTVKSLQDTIELLDMHHAPTLGIVLIGTLATREMYAYYHSYYYSTEESRRGRKGGTPPADETDGRSAESDAVVHAREEEPAYARNTEPPPYLPPTYGQPGQA